MVTKAGVQWNSDIDHWPAPICRKCYNGPFWQALSYGIDVKNVHKNPAGDIPAGAVVWFMNWISFCRRQFRP